MKYNLLFVLFLGLSSFGYAQVLDTTHLYQLKEIEITQVRTDNEKPLSIGKIPIRPMDLPQSVTQIDQIIIQNQQAQKLSDVIRNANGIYLGGMRASTQETFYARGYNLGSTNTFKNGFRVNNGAMPEMSAIESIEILKGSAALLYGNVAPGGIINMVTKKPKFDFGGQVSMRVGSFNLYKPTIDIYGPISKKIAYRLNGTYENTKSFREVVHSEKYYVNPSLLFKLTDKTTLIVEGDYLATEFTPDFGIGTLSDKESTIGGKNIPQVPRAAFFGADWQYAKVKQATTSFNISHNFNSNWSLNLISGFQNYQRDYFSLERVQLNKWGDFKRPLGKNMTKQNYYTGQLFITGNFDTGTVKHKMVVGADFEQDNTALFTSNLVDRSIYDTLNIYNPNKFPIRTDMPQYTWITKTLNPIMRTGFYVQDLVALSDKVKVLAGVRWSSQVADKSQVTNLVTNKEKQTGNIKTDQAFSPRIGVVYQPIKKTAVFASYSNSFSPNSGLDKDSTALRPSIIDQYEVGIKNDFLNGAMSANLTFYRIINNNISQPLLYFNDGSPTDGNTTLRELSGQTTSDGVELDIRVNPATGWYVVAGYSYNYMRYTKTTGKKGSYVENIRLINTPAHTANLTAFYTFRNNKLQNLKLGAGMYYVGDRNAGWNRTYTNNEDKKDDRMFSVQGFATIDVSAGYTYKNWSVMAKLANITNVLNYYIHENYSINPIPPRNFVITLGYKF